MGLGVVAVLLVRPRRVSVEGESMMPSLAPGDRLLVLNLGGARPGDIVALHDPDQVGRLLVKRVATVGPVGVEVLGDNATASRDSRRFGPVPPSLLLGRAVYRYFPSARASSLRHLGVSGGTLSRDGPAPRGHRPAAGGRADQ
ncbi:MAG: nickel-type superoxide dismutase maturation protease [Acidimicrobiales bacterium]